MENKKVALIILDGWGLGRKDLSDAVFSAKTPVMDQLQANRPTGQLLTDGENVGLPVGQMGNSEVGHMNIGAGRIVYQDLLRINRAIESGDFHSNGTLNLALDNAAAKGASVHLMGLVSDGGVHSSQEHLHALCDLCVEKGLENVFIHAFTDGRDTDPESGKEFLTKLERYIEHGSCRLASIIGRYYAMDRDKRWERVKRAYDLLVRGVGATARTGSEALSKSYAAGITDEFVEPIVLDPSSNSRIKAGDTVICFNFRTDRCREITEVLTQNDMPEFGMTRLKLNYVTMTNYDSSYHGVKVVYDKDNLELTLGEVIAGASRTQLRAAETEKYPHVTFFFSGGREAIFTGEERVLVNSPKVATYDLQPEMSAPELAARVIEKIELSQPDFICLNFANPDMVGHTGVFSAIVQACECVDSCLAQVLTAGTAHGYSFIIIADHGNADFAVNDDGTPNTAHSLNPVPVIIVDSAVKKVNDGILADVAPTVLELMNIDQPSAMTGKSLIL